MRATIERATETHFYTHAMLSDGARWAIIFRHPVGEPDEFGRYRTKAEAIADAKRYNITIERNA